MKTSFILVILSLMTVMLSPSNSLAEPWTAVLRAESQAAVTVGAAEVTIGSSQDGQGMEAPPAPPEYAVLMYLFGPAGARLLTDIRREDEARQVWTLCLEPRGNRMPPVARTAVLSWEPAQLGPGSFVMREGVDGAGPLLVEDMKEITFLELTSVDQVCLSIEME